MQRLISLFNTVGHEELRLSQTASGPPPTPAPDHSDRDPEYFRHLLDYLRDRKQADEQTSDASEEVFA